MAVLYSLPNKRVKAGKVIDNQPITLPAGVSAITWTITAGDLANPSAESIAAWLERNDGGTWTEIARFEAYAASSSTGRADVRGDGLRVSLVCNLGTTVSALVESV